MIAGDAPADMVDVSTTQVGDVAQAQASRETDKKNILAYIESEEGVLEHTNFLVTILRQVDSLTWLRARSEFRARKRVQGSQEFRVRKDRSERLGVCAQYTVGEFVKDARAAASVILKCPEAYELRSPMEDVNNPNFYELAPVMCYGDKSRGHSKICPRDGKRGWAPLVIAQSFDTLFARRCAVVDALSMEGAGKAAQTTHFLSWTWVYRIGPFTSSIDSWIQQNNLDSSNVFIWVCFFCK